LKGCKETNSVIEAVKDTGKKTLMICHPGNSARAKKEKGLFLDDTAYEYPNGECKERKGESFVVKV
jgi:hypothetical protein